MNDLIERQAVMDCFKKWQPYMATRIWDFEKELSTLPSVSTEKPNRCEDAISKQEVLDEINRIGVKAFKTYNDYSELFDFVDSLPSVNSQANKEDIHREREQAYMCGYEDAYKKGWHDAITAALKETHSVCTEDGHFRVVQEETLIGIGMAYEPQESEDAE